MKRDINFSNFSRKQLLEFCYKIIEEKEALEARFYQMEKERNEALKIIEKYEEKMRMQRQRSFGRKSETNIKQKVEEETVFNEAEKEIQEKEENNEPRKHTGRTRGSKNYDTAYLESHVTETITLEPEDIEELKKEGNLIQLEDDVYYKIRRIPGQLYVTKIRCPKYLDKKNNKFYQAVKDDPFPHSLCTAELAAEIMTNKFELGLPYYRQAAAMFNGDLSISRQNLCNYQLRATAILEPMYHYLKKLLLATPSKVIYADETTLKVIESKKSKCYAWVYSTGFYDHPIYIYDFEETRARENIVKFLEDFNGYLVTDKYSGYGKLDNIDNAYCWVHARRNFTDILQTLNKNLWKDSKAYKIVQLIDELFRREAEFKKQGFGPNEIKEQRNKEEYLNVLDNIFNILETTEPEKGSSLENAYNYILKDKEKFKTFLKDGHIELSNNISERAIKPFVIDRKNFLFSNTINGANSSLIFFSLQQTARANGVKAYDYIRDLINVLYKDQSEETLEKFLPWNYKKENNEKS